MKNILDNGSLRLNSPSDKSNDLSIALPHQVLYVSVSVRAGFNILFIALIDDAMNPATANWGINQGNNLNVAFYPPSPICLNNLLFVAESTKALN